MTENDILDAIGDIDPAYLEEAESKTSAFGAKWIRLGSLAACLLVLLMFPLGYFQYLWSMENDDYAPQAQKECAVYYVQDGEILFEDTVIFGGEAEMFASWMEKNKLKGNIDLRELSFSYMQSEGEEDGVMRYDVTVTVPETLSGRFEKEDRALLLEALKKTIASYQSITVDELKLIYS